MPEKCNWIVFQAHATQFNKKEDHHPDFFGTFVCPALRREPEQLLGEVLSNQKLFLVQINSTKSVDKDADWGMNERLKAQIDDQGFGLSMTKIQQGVVPFD
jgi:hypothetical protein